MKEINKENKKLTLQDWITRFEMLEIDEDQKITVELQNKKMKDNYCLFFEITKDPIKYGNATKYNIKTKNILKIYYCLDCSTLHEYKPTFYELGLTDWQESIINI